MKRKRVFINITEILLGIFIVVPSLLGSSNLISVRKGSSGEKSWAVFSFDEKLNWFGESQSESDKLSIYFFGNAGNMDQSVVTMDSTYDRTILIKQLSKSPPIFRADILCDRGVPLAVLKRGVYLVVSFNDQRLLQGKVSSSEDLPASSGQLVNIIQDIKKDHITTSFQFDGNYEWLGFVRTSKEDIVLIFQGAGIVMDKNESFFNMGPLKTIQLSIDEDDFPILKANLFIQYPSPFSIIKKSQTLLIQTPTSLTQTDQGNQASLVLPEESKSETEGISELSEKENLRSRKESEENKFQPQSTITTEKINNAEIQNNQIPWDRKVTFQFQSTPIKDALRLLAESNKLNMVIGEGVDAKISMNLENVTLKQALDMIVNTNNYEYIIDGNIITIKPVTIVYAGGRITKTYRLKYADAANVANVIKKVASSDSLVEVYQPEFLNFLEAGKNRMKMGGVAVQGIRRASVLVVTDRPEKIKEIDQMVQELDKLPIQIMIESKLVELAPAFSNNLGIDWDNTFNLLWSKTSPTEATTEKTFKVESGSAETARFSMEKNWRLGHLSASQYAVMLDFLKEKTEAKLISNPRLLAMDNEESSISVGTTVPIPQIQRGIGGTGDMVTFTYKEVNIQLNVSPHVGNQGEIIMYVNPVIEEITDWVEVGVSRAPITNKRAVNSIITVNTGETIVIGGLIRNQRLRVVKKVWILGNLPLFGKFFQHERFEDKQTDLMIFITPTVIQSG